MVTLYIKTHKNTGIKYFGKTIRDPFKYKGSGSVWNDILKEHGNDIHTEIYRQFDEECEELRECAIKFSIDNDIVNSDKWANQVPETGTELSSGLPTGWKHTQSTKDKISKSNKGKSLTDEQLQRLRENTTRGENHFRFTTPVSEETKKKMSESRKGKYKGEDNPFYGKKHTMEVLKLLKEKSTGVKCSEETKKKMSESHKGEKNHFYGKTHNNETKNIISEKIKNLEKVVCPYCNKKGSPGGMGRWHFDNCKFKN